jgi:hypothetical protein
VFIASKLVYQIIDNTRFFLPGHNYNPAIEFLSTNIPGPMVLER